MSNPYLDEWAKYEPEDWSKMPDDRYVERTMDKHRARGRLTKQYAWAIPSDEAIALCVKYSPLVEMGAGTGYWAHLIQQASGDIIAYDIKPYKNYQADGHWTDVHEGGPNILRHRHHERTLLLCWPPYSDNMAARSVRLHQSRRVIYIGEGEGGCTGNDAFHRLLKRHFEDVVTLKIPQWDYVHDYLMVYERKASP